MSHSRQDFEKWYAGERPDMEYPFERVGNDSRYASYETEWAFRGWRAGPALEGKPTAIVNVSGVLEWYPPYNRPPAGTKLYTHPASREALEGEPVAWWDGDTSAAEDSFSFKLDRFYTIPLYTHPASANDAKHHAVMQAQMWAQEARTQKAIVKEIGELVGCANDWEMVEAVRNALATLPPAPPKEQGHE